MKILKRLKALEDYRLWLVYDDGVEGEVDLSELRGDGVFEAWEGETVFHEAGIGEGGRSVEWGDDLELCADSLYLKLTRKRPEEIFPELAEASALPTMRSTQ